MNRSLRHSPWCGLLLACSATHAGDLGVNVYGFSYHWDRALARAHHWDNEFNPGLGLRYRFGQWIHADVIADGGAYRDSGRNTALYAGAGLLWPLGDARRVHLGAVLTAFDSDTYNGGDAFVAPVPLFTVDFDRMTVNLTHFPKVGDFNRINTTALFFTFPLR